MMHITRGTNKTAARATLVRVYAEGTRGDLCGYEPEAWARVEDMRRAFHVLCAQQVLLCSRH